MTKAGLVFATLLLTGCDAALSASSALPDPSSVTSGDGPFGIEMGTPISRFEVLDTFDDGTQKVVIKGYDNALMDFYEVRHTSEDALCMITGVGRDVTSGDEGQELRSDMQRLKQALARTYGQPDNVYLQGPDNSAPAKWLGEIRDETRSHRFCWLGEDGEDYPNDVESICLTAKSVNDGIGYSVIRYEFDNFDDCEAEREAEGLADL